MPLYEYECQQCRRHVEKIQKFSDAPLTTCAHCGGTLERTITAAAVQFKGAGWYKDLYSSAKPAAASSSGEGSGTSGSGNSAAPATGTAETKPAAAASPAPAASTSAGTGSTGS